MLVKTINEETKQITEYATGTDKDWFISQGYKEIPDKDIEVAYNGEVYLRGYAPEKPQELTDQEEILELKQYLSETDWYYTRQLETGEVIPDNVREKRIEARNRINELEDRNSQEYFMEEDKIKPNKKEITKEVNNGNK